VVASRLKVPMAIELPPPSLIHAAIAHIEDALDKSRVLVVGSALGGTGEVVIARGARLCQVLDPDARHVATAAQRNTERRITFSQLSDLSLRDGAFDVIVVENLADLPEPAELLDSLRRTLSSDGIALIASRAEGSSDFLSGSGETTSYADFVRSVRGVFASTIFAAQTPFVASAIVRLDLTAAPAPALDNAFLAGEADEVSQYLALAGTTEALTNLELEDMSVVQFRARAAMARGNTETETRVLRAERRVSALEQELELERARPKPQVSPREVELKEALETQERELERVRKERKWADDRVRRLERELEEALEAQEELGKAQERIATLQGHLKDSEDEVDQLTDKLYAIEPELERLKSELLARPTHDSDLEKEVQSLEAQLVERGNRVNELEQKLGDLDVVIRALEVQANRATHLHDSNETAQKLLEVSADLAAREAELQSLRWALDAATRRPLPPENDSPLS
jgi:SAM-dependent methyltransferase